MKRQLIIIGSGPAGWTAGVYAARASLQPLLLEGALSAENQEKNTLPMGQLALTTEVENYPGFPMGDLSQYLQTSLDAGRLAYLAPHAKKGVTGPELMELMRQQAIQFGTEVISEDAVKIEPGDGCHKVHASDGTVYQTDAVIVATGARANWLNLPSEAVFKNRGVSACAVCDGALPRFRNQPVAVIGGGDSAMEDAIYLTHFASKVYLIHRRNEFRASAFMVQKALDNPKIEPVYSYVVKEILGEEKAGVTQVSLQSTQGEADKTLDVSGVFVLIGHTPNTDFLQDVVELDSHRYIVRPQPGRTMTSVEGIFAAGDCADSIYRQAITAAASGCMAAIDAERWLLKRI